LDNNAEAPYQGVELDENQATEFLVVRFGSDPVDYLALHRENDPMDRKCFLRMRAKIAVPTLRSRHPGAQGPFGSGGHHEILRTPVTELTSRPTTQASGLSSVEAAFRKPRMLTPCSLLGLAISLQPVAKE
jgi:hypothetical protein